MTDAEIDKIATRIFELVKAEYAKREEELLASFVSSLLQERLPSTYTTYDMNAPGFPYYVSANPTITTKQFYGEKENDHA